MNVSYENKQLNPAQQALRNLETALAAAQDRATKAEQALQDFKQREVAEQMRTRRPGQSGFFLAPSAERERLEADAVRARADAHQTEKRLQTLQRVLANQA